MAPNNDSGAFADQRLVLVCENAPERQHINRAAAYATIALNLAIAVAVLFFMPPLPQ